MTSALTSLNDTFHHLYLTFGWKDSLGKRDVTRQEVKKYSEVKVLRESHRFSANEVYQGDQGSGSGRVGSRSVVRGQKNTEVADIREESVLGEESRENGVPYYGVSVVYECP